MTAQFLARTLCAALAVTLLALLPAVGGTARAADLADLLPVCAGCHGEKGLPTEPDIPIIWGQEFYYLYVQLKDYQAGRRANEIMQGIVADLSKEDMQNLAKHFSEQSWPSIGFEATDADTARAKSAINAGMCTQCHLGKFQGNSRVPRTGGQQPGYLERTMFELKNKVRLNAAAMASLMADFSDEDIRAMANYLAGF